MTGLGVLLCTAVLLIMIWRYPAPLLLEHLAHGQRWLRHEIGRLLLLWLRGPDHAPRRAAVRAGRGAGLACTAGAVAVTILAHPVVLAGIATIYAVAVWVLSEAGPVPQGTPDPDGANAPESGPDASAIDPVVLLCWQLSEGVSGVHTTALVDVLNRNPDTTPLTASDVRAYLTTLGVRERGPVRGWKQGRVGGPKGVSQGIHREDLETATGPCPDPLPPLPEWAVAAPVATTTTQVNGGVAAATTGVATGVATGPGPVITPDPTHPSRHTVQH